MTFNSLIFDIFHILTFKFHLILYFIIHSCSNWHFRKLKKDLQTAKSEGFDKGPSSPEWMFKEVACVSSVHMNYPESPYADDGSSQKLETFSMTWDHTEAEIKRLCIVSQWKCQRSDIRHFITKNWRKLQIFPLHIFGYNKRVFANTQKLQPLSTDCKPKGMMGNTWRHLTRDLILNQSAL